MGVVVPRGNCLTNEGRYPRGSCPRGSCPRGSYPGTGVHIVASVFPYTPGYYTYTVLCYSYNKM